MSGLEFNKIAGAVLTAAVVAWAAFFVAELLTGGEGHEVAENAYPVGGMAESTTAPEDVETQAAAVSLGALLAGASAEDGQKVARKCKTCHTFEQGGANKIGPNLWSVVGRSIAGTDGFKYSSAMGGMSGEAWSYENLDAFLAKPKDWAPGTKMAFAGLKKPADRAALIAYLRELHDDPPPLPE